MCRKPNGVAPQKPRVPVLGYPEKRIAVVPTPTVLWPRCPRMMNDQLGIRL